MTTKLTLTVEKTVIEKAKLYAKETGRSLSDIIESYLENLVNDKQPDDKISSKLKSLIGSVKVPENFDEKTELDKYFSEKYL